MNVEGARILVIGDVMLDHYISGTCSRISPEAPVPVVMKRNAWSVPGGAANVARGLAYLGCQAELIGLIGEDAAGVTLRQQILANGIRGQMVTSPSRPTTCKTRIVVQGQQLLRLDEETPQSPSPREFASLRVQLMENMAGSEAIILSDYAKGVLSADTTGDSLARLAIVKASERNIPVLVDPKGNDWERYRGAACITPNTGEFLAICEKLGFLPGPNPDRRLRAEMAHAVCNKFEIQHLLLTRGKKGMTLFTPGEGPEHIKAAMREVADVSGAGDTVIATLGACIAKGIPWGEAARIANAAAGIAVTKVGAAPVGIGELNQVLEGNSGKLCAWPALEEKLRLWRDDGQRIVFTNGCFDILHPGHIAMLRQSAAMGDRLIIGLNTDASVRRLKGSERPIQNEESRAILLGALQFVDAVILFDEDTPERLIRQIHPDILVKGDDYTLKDIAGAEFVQGYGGRVELIPLVQGFSTTDIARRIQHKGSAEASRQVL